MTGAIRVYIAGITGNVGSLLAAAVHAAPDLVLSGGTSKTRAGKRIREVVAGCPSDILITDNLNAALEAATDVLVDYTHPDVVKQNTLEAVEAGVHVVVGTSGLSDADYEEIDRSARRAGVGVLAAGNFSLSGALMQHFALIAAKHLPTWEIVDFGTEHKPDAPSGTARELAFRLAQVRRPEYAVSPDEVVGEPEARGATVNGSQVHSLRLPGYFSRSELLFGAPEQRLTVRYEAIGSRPYVDGTLLAVRKVSGLTGLRRGLDHVLDL